MSFAPIFDSMFHLPLPIVEKLARPVVIYLVLVVLLSLSNTVQNAIIGDDNSVTGGVIGAFGLLAINWLVVRVLFRSRRLTRALEGRSAILIRNGQLDVQAMNREALTREELLSVVHRQGFEDFHAVRKCELEPNGTFYVEAFDPSVDDKRHAELLARIDALAREVAALRGGTADGTAES